MTQTSELLDKVIKDEGIECSMLGDNKVISVKDFSILTRRSVVTIYKLIREGNRIRKLKAIKVCHSVFIPISEVLEYPFTASNSYEVFTFNIVDEKLKEVKLSEEKNTKV